MSVPTFCAGRQAETVGGIQWQTHEIETELVCPLTGKKIYRKCIDCGLGADGSGSAAANTTAHGITGLNVAEGAYMRIWGVVSDATTVEPLSQATFVTLVEVNATNIVITSDGEDHTGHRFIAFLEYTKT